MSNKKKNHNPDYFIQLRESSERYYDDKPALNWGENIGGEYIIPNRYYFKWETVPYGKKSKKNYLTIPIEEYILNFKKKCESEGRQITVYIGVDSQPHHDKTRFIAAVVMKVHGNGCHLLISKVDLKKIYHDRYRLLRETDMGVECARNLVPFLNANGIDFGGLHADYNSNTNRKSNGVVIEATNYAKFLGLDLIIKPNSWAASKAADPFSKKPG